LRPARSLCQSARSNERDRSGGRCVATNVEAHITGTIFRIETALGASVQAGDALVIIESMKMEMPVEAPRAGRVQKILVSEGQSVREGETVVILE
jgi:acetyl-CoA carboxylase biotin carboxyl carrier protein